MSNQIQTCLVCYLINCCCEADRLEDLKNENLEIEEYHNAKPGTRLWRKRHECPCKLHRQLANK